MFNGSEQYEIIFRLIKQVFIVLLSFTGSFTNIVNASDHTKYISLSNQQCLTWPNLINLHPNKVNLDRCIVSKVVI